MRRFASYLLTLNGTPAPAQLETSTPLTATLAIAMTPEAATPDFRALLSCDGSVSDGREMGDEAHGGTNAGETDAETALREMLNTPPMSAHAAFTSFAGQEPFTPISSTTSSPAYFSFSPTLEPNFPTSSAMSFQDSTSSTTTSLRGAFSLPSPASTIFSCSPQALTRSPSAQSFSRPLAEQLESAVAVLKSSSSKKPPAVKRLEPRRPQAATTLPLPLMHPAAPSLLPPSTTFVIPAPTHPRARSVSRPVVEPKPEFPALSESLFRPESPEAVEQDQEEVDPPSTPPSSALLPPANLPPTPVESIMVEDEPEKSLVQRRREKHKAKRQVEGYIPRPPNAWMLYRSARVREFAEREKRGGSRVPMQSDLSKIIGEMWRSEPLDIRETYAKLALAERDEHARRYPGYVFRPIRWDSTKRASPSTSTAAAGSEPKRARRPALKKSHTAPTSGALLPAIEITSTPIPTSFPSVLAPPPATPVLMTTYVDVREGFWSPPTTATSEAWTAYSTAPATWHDSKKEMDISSLQLDFGPSCPSTPFSAPATLSTFDFSFALPPPPLISISSPSTEDASSSSSVADLLKVDPMTGLPTPPAPPTTELSSSASSSSSVLDEIMAALDRAPPSPAAGLAASTSSIDTLVLPPLDAPASLASPMMSEQELQEIIAQLSTAP